MNIRDERHPYLVLIRLDQRRLSFAVDMVNGKTAGKSARSLHISNEGKNLKFYIGEITNSSKIEEEELHTPMDLREYSVRLTYP